LGLVLALVDAFIRKGPGFVRWLRNVAFVLEIVIAVPLSIWAAMAIYFDSPIASLRTIAAVLYVAAVVAACFLLRRNRWWLVTAYAAFALVAIWWLSIEPPNDRDWKPDKVYTASAKIDGDQITIQNVRNCDYRTELDYSCEWATRSYNLANLRGADLFITWWGSPWIAHPIVSFDFGDQGHVAMSIETRDVVGQSYSAVRGFFRQYALAYVVSDERDVIRLRTNYRKGEEVYLFRTTADPALARKLFLDYLVRVNELHARPEWYNALTNNCTTNIAVSIAEARDISVNHDWRILLNGKLDELLYKHNGIVTDGRPLPALKKQAHINAAARAADKNPDFSKIIREGRIGFGDSSAVSSIR
jgi:hypothetical protein